MLANSVLHTTVYPWARGSSSATPTANDRIYGLPSCKKGVSVHIVIVFSSDERLSLAILAIWAGEAHTATGDLAYNRGEKPSGTTRGSWRARQIGKQGEGLYKSRRGRGSEQPRRMLCDLTLPFGWLRRRSCTRQSASVGRLGWAA